MDERVFKSLDSRLDLEVYIMGEMKYEFMSFLGECYKENFYETLSWGNFRRFQLTLIGKRNWINIYFILLKNEITADVLINTFKAYEKRNNTMILYNINDLKSKKAAETLQELLIFERNKFYEGILNDNSIKKNMKKLSDEQMELKVDIDTETLKENLNYLVDNEHTLIHKIGFLPNQTNKKTKNVKKTESSASCYELDNPIFFLHEKEKCVFNEVVNFMVTEHFNKLNVDEKDYEQFLKVIVEYSNQKSFEYSPTVKQQQGGSSSLLNYVFKSIDWLILFYILVCFYNFLIN